MRKHSPVEVNGESGADVYDRCTLFMDTLFRQLNSGYYQHTDNILIVSHDIFIRLFVTRYFRLTADEHHRNRDLKNCEHVLLEYDYHTGKYELKTELTKRRESLVLDYNATAAASNKLLYKHTK
jgi:broad specificity phosphatase PhoE